MTRKTRAVNNAIASVTSTSTKPAPVSKTTKAKAKAAQWTEFISAKAEAHEYPVMGIRPYRLKDRRIVWRVPSDQADKFMRHHFCVTNRIVKRA